MYHFCCCLFSKASGGSRNYHWSSQNYTIASITNKGLATSGNLIGSTKIKASDTKNALHYGEATLMLLAPDEMHFMPTAVEAEIGKTLLLPLSVSAYVDFNGEVIYICDLNSVSIFFCILYQ